jgi:hypothetical protein
MIVRQLISEEFLVQMCAVFLKEGYIEIIQHKLSKFRISKFRHSNHSNRFAHLHESGRTLRDGSFGMPLSQALRARLRSHRPSGTFRNGL